MERPEPEMDTEGDVIAQRIGAYIIDLIIVFIVSFILLFVLILLGGVIGAAGGQRAGGFLAVFFSLGWLLLVALQFLYWIVLEALYGQTLGKRVLGIVVVKTDGEPCDWVASIIRNVARIIDQLPFFYILGIILILITDRNQRVGDLVGSTVVVKTK